MEGLEEQLNKMLGDYSELNKQNDALFCDTQKQISEIKNEEHASFLNKSLSDAKSGRLNISEFLESCKKLNTL